MYTEHYYTQNKAKQYSEETHRHHSYTKSPIAKAKVVLNFLTFCCLHSHKNASVVYDSYEFSAKSCGCFLRQQKPFREDDELDETDFYDDDSSWQQQ